MDDKEVINAFIEYLRNNAYPDLKVDRWPDEENRNSSDIDAVAGKFAIEHTSIDTIINQRRDSDWFMQAVGQLEKELSPKLKYHLSITIPYEGIQKGHNFSSIKERLRSWILNDSAKLPDCTRTISGVTGIPFEFRVIKASDRSPGLFFSRFVPDDPALPNRLKELLDRKAEKLASYKNDGKTTILLVESGDIALMNESKMLKAIRTGFGNSLPEGVDQIWYVHTFIVETDLQFYNFTSDILSKME